MTLWNGALLAFCIFNLLCLLFIWWGLRAGQRALDKRFELEDAEWREALRKLAP